MEVQYLFLLGHILSQLVVEELENRVVVVMDKEIVVAIPVLPNQELI